MPTDRFFRLPEKKQQVIYNAAIQEFSRVSIEKASINRIIQDANISRGSFYTYFNDKADLLRYVTSNKLSGVGEVMAEAIKESGGDYFVILDKVFDYFVTESQRTTQMLDFLKNVMGRRDILRMLGIEESPPSPRKVSGSGGPIENLWEHLDQSKFNFKDPGDHVALMTLGAASLMTSVLSFYNYPEQLKLIRNNFHTSLEILKNGCYKSEEAAGGVRV